MTTKLFAYVVKNVKLKVEDENTYEIIIRNMIIIGNKIAIVVEFKTLKIVNMKFPERYLVCEIS